MNVVDEATSAHLYVSVQDCRTVAQMDLKGVVQVINECFKRWGLPEHIKIDNGMPFVHPKQMDIPTLAKLWWIGLGINVTQNTPRCPQENGAVECSQGVLSRWSNPAGQDSVVALQERLNEESNFQRNHYRMPNRANRTRMELYPELETNGRTYDSEQFDIKRVYKYLSRQVWKRTVKRGGEVKFFGHLIYIGNKYAKDSVFVTFDPIEAAWLFRLADGTFVKSSKTGVPKKLQITAFALSGGG